MRQQIRGQAGTAFSSCKPLKNTDLRPDNNSSILLLRRCSDMTLVALQPAWPLELHCDLGPGVNLTCRQSVAASGELQPGPE